MGSRALCALGCGRFAFAPRFRTCCQRCPSAHTSQCGHRQPEDCCYGCGRRANRPRHTSCCRLCPEGHTWECSRRRSASFVAGPPLPPEGDLCNAHRDGCTDWVWVFAEHGLFIERGDIVGLPLPAGTLTLGDRGILPRGGGAVFICRLPGCEVRRFRRDGPTGALGLREGLLSCFGCRDAETASRCNGCRGHLCGACGYECHRCDTLFCAACVDEHLCSGGAEEAQE